jgi:hypothetical protein
MDAWRRQYGQDSRLALVADDSLSHHLDSAADMTAFDRARRDGELTVVRYADPEILNLARDGGLHVITRDHYGEFRREHRWIDASPGRFHWWETEGGQVRIIPLGIRPLSDSEVSMVAEVKDLERRRLGPRNPRYRSILQTLWQCGNPRCREAMNPQGHLLGLPAVTYRGDPCCPACHGELMNLGPRENVYGIVVSNAETGKEIVRFPLEVNVPVIVGRGGRDARKSVVPLWVDEGPSDREALTKVSRQHVCLLIEEPRRGSRRLRVKDLGSTSGTKVRHPSLRGPARILGAEKELPPDEEVSVAEGGQVILANAITLRLSGRKYVPGSYEVSGPLLSGGSIRDHKTIG